MLADLIEVKTVDDIILGGAYFAPESMNLDGSVDVMCFFHGDGGHFYNPLYLGLGKWLAQQGIAFLTANRRGHDIVSHGVKGGPPKGYAFESVDEARGDYTAWLEFLKARGHKRIAIGGHSGGAVRAVYSQCKEQFPDVVAIVAVSPGEYNHEGLAKLHPGDFSRVYNEAEREIRNGRPDTFFTPGMPWGSTWSAKAFVDCFNKDNRYSVSELAKNIKCSALFIFGAEEIDGPEILPACSAAFRAIRSVNYTDICVEIIEGANHSYQGRECFLYQTIYQWLKTT